MADAVQAGLVRAVGVSNYGATRMRRAYEALARRGVVLASNQVEYSLLHRKPERNGVLAACRELGVTLIAYSPLAMGVLTGKYGPDRPPADFRRGRYGRAFWAKAEPLLTTLRAIAEARGKTPAQVALNGDLQGRHPHPGGQERPPGSRKRRRPGMASHGRGSGGPGCSRRGCGWRRASPCALMRGYRDRTCTAPVERGRRARVRGGTLLTCDDDTLMTGRCQG